ncbi:MAG: TIGR00730 family Rossman fold protein [Parcubacteria group bacterium]|nr:TIGR00730 family Rossman fold protein [Parcubacteria group bacterium]|tara:strand:- start:9319 stop:10029 length:711 start_codon:yes stop_codon:yes gene_type:complete
MAKKKKKEILNLPSVKLPIKPLTSQDIDKDIQRRVSKINKELKGGFDFIKSHPKSVTFFGSARLKKDSPYYQKAIRLGERLVKLGYSLVTGGGPGIMEAGNQGAMKGYGQSVGLTIKLPGEQVRNPYLTNFFNFHYFFTRKVCLTFSAEAYVYFPGGFGTLDEFFEILTLVQTNKIEKVPIILVGREFWQPLHSFMERNVYRKKAMISKEDMKFYRIVDDENKIIEIIKKAPIRRG